MVTFGAKQVKIQSSAATLLKFRWRKVSLSEGVSYRIRSDLRIWTSNSFSWLETHVSSYCVHNVIYRVTPTKQQHYHDDHSQNWLITSWSYTHLHGVKTSSGWQIGDVLIDEDPKNVVGVQVLKIITEVRETYKQPRWTTTTLLPDSFYSPRILYSSVFLIFASASTAVLETLGAPGKLINTTLMLSLLPWTIKESNETPTAIRFHWPLQLPPISIPSTDRHPTPDCTLSPGCRSLWVEIEGSRPVPDCSLHRRCHHRPTPQTRLWSTPWSER